MARLISSLEMQLSGVWSYPSETDTISADKALGLVRVSAGTGTFVVIINACTNTGGEHTARYILLLFPTAFRKHFSMFLVYVTCYFQPQFRL